jgi:hypothetical protein
VLAAESLSFGTARVLGNVWTLTELWKELGFSERRRVLRRTRCAIDVEALIRSMVLPSSTSRAADSSALLLETMTWVRDARFLVVARLQ